MMEEQSIQFLEVDDSRVSGFDAFTKVIHSRTQSSLHQCNDAKHAAFAQMHKSL